jgi:hypothetical protein
MAKADREPIPLYRVWQPGDESEEDGRDWGALDLERAAQVHADYCYRHRDGYEWSWPATFHVRDPVSGKVYEISVDLDMDPVFRPGRPKEIA